MGTDKVNATRALRAKGLANAQPTTLLFEDNSVAEELQQLDAELAKWMSMSRDTRPPGDAVAFIHERRGRENSQGITLLSWNELQERRNRDNERKGTPLKDFLVPGILQRYLDPPLLLRGHKADLRCFILV